MSARWMLAVMLVCPIAQAAGDGTDPCVRIHDAAKRLACFDAELNYKPPERASIEQPEPKPPVVVTIREKGNFTNFAGADLVDKPGQLNLQRSDGKDSSTVKVAALAAFRPINDLGWQPFAALAWNRDTSGSKPSDKREIGAGIAGPLWDAAESGWTLFPTVRWMYRDDHFGTADSSVLSLHINVVKLSWVTAIAKAKANSFSLVPQLGYLSENRNGGGLDEGGRRSGYMGIESSAQLNRVVPRLTASLSFRRYVDVSVPDGSTKRRVNYANWSLSYALTDPEDKSLALRPYLSLSREVGTDVLGGGDSTNRTLLGLGVKFN